MKCMKKGCSAGKSAQSIVQPGGGTTRARSAHRRCSAAVGAKGYCCTEVRGTGRARRINRSDSFKGHAKRCVPQLYFSGPVCGPFYFAATPCTACPLMGGLSAWRAVFFSLCGISAVLPSAVCPTDYTLSGRKTIVTPPRLAIIASPSLSGSKAEPTPYWNGVISSGFPAIISRHRAIISSIVRRVTGL